VTLGEYLLNAYSDEDNQGCYHQCQSTAEIEAQERFRITNDSQANWALRKIADARKKLARDQETAKAEIERIQQWLKMSESEAARTEERMTALLHEYYAPQFQTDPKTKTYKLPSGKVQWWAQQPQFNRDDATLLEFLKSREMTDFIETKETPKWGELKKQIQVVGEHVVVKDGKMAGEIIDGVEVVHRPPTFRVVTTEGDDGNGI
jgi:phage host-nuclease inhibitor protein Gam